MKMKKKSLALVIMLLGMASFLVAMAYTSAEAKAGYTLSVTNTDEALLALIPNEDADGTAEIKEGRLELSFGAIQPDSIYFWKDLVTVKNNSKGAVEVKFAVKVDEGEESYVAITDAEGKAIEDIELAGEGTQDISFKVTVPEGANSGDSPGTIIVSATAVEK